MMKKRILKVIGLLGVCGILEITTPAVTFAETSTTDTSGMSDEEVYEKEVIQCVTCRCTCSIISSMW